MTSLNLKVLPLKFLETLSQKCLLPEKLFPTAKGWTPGAWTKCMFDDFNAFSVCRIFPLTAIVECCYLDECVTSRQIGGSEKKLTSLRLLHEVVVTEVELIITITEKFLRREQISIEKLKDAVQFQLQAFNLVVNCSVQSKELLNLGIAAVEIVSANGTNADENTCFVLHDETILNILDVKLLNTNLPHQTTNFYSYGYEKPLRELADLLQLADLQCRHKSFNLNALIVGAAGSGKSTLLAQWIEQSNCNCFCITASKVLGQYAGDTETELFTIFAMLRAFCATLKPKSPTIILLDNLHLLCPALKSNVLDNGNAMRISTQLLSLIDDLRSSDGAPIICLATTNAPDMLNEQARRAGRFEREITIALPTEDERGKMFNAIFTEHITQFELPTDLLNLVVKQTQGYVVADLALLVRNISQALLMIMTTTAVCDLENIVKIALQHSQPSSIRGTDICVYKTTAGFELIGGMQALKRTLEVSILAGLKEQAAFARFGLSMPKGVLLYGPPGCAKTTIAKCLANEANMTFIATSGAEVYSPYVGCAERFIAKIFDTARKNTPCLIFFDEIDTLVGRRSIEAGSAGSVQLRILSTLLTEMDGVIAAGDGQQHILVVAATNRPDMIDDALLRPGRFDKLIHVPAPDRASRLSILQLFAQRMPFASNVNLSQIAAQTDIFSGADLCNICNETAMHAFQRDFDTCEIDMQDFDAVLKTQKSSLTQHQINWYNEFEKKILK